MQANEALYSKECSGNPCWAVNSTSPATLKFSDYRKLCYKWQHAVLGALRTALASKEYVQTRNALLFLSYNTKVGRPSADCLPHCSRGESTIPLSRVHVQCQPLLAYMWARLSRAMTRWACHAEPLPAALRPLYVHAL